ncbi:MAG: FAD-binding protein [Bacteroidales bacterium]|nr:FAD-binding protein [Bacteroidales bacterium]
MNSFNNTITAELIIPNFKGEVRTDFADRLRYATDASAYREVPVGIAYPIDNEDIKALISFANESGIPLIPRTAGTSLAGQVVGSGLIVDVSIHLTKVLEINVEERFVWVQPSVILDELNMLLKPHGLFFGPETSTSSRCMIGGMVGNNSCGAHSLIYGSTREHTLAVRGFLSDGTEVQFSDLSPTEFLEKTKVAGLEGEIYRQAFDCFSKESIQNQIAEEFPDPRLERRNTGYAIDLLANTSPFKPNAPAFNFSKMIAGSEGTLMFITAVKLNLVPLPPPVKALVCVHLETVPQAIKANIIALKHQPVAVELMDKAIMDLTKENKLQEQNRFFVQGDPGALLIVEFAEKSMEIIENKASAMEMEMRAQDYGFHFPLVTGTDIKRVWTLRKAGLGVLSNMPGDAKPVPVIEDTAVHPDLLPDFIADLDKVLEDMKLDCVYYAHIATGELHLRPVLNLKLETDVGRFRQIALETAKLVKKYKGSLSGEHGDGRLRGEFIPLMIGEANYQIIKDIKKLWDPKGIFNPGKIVDTPPMNSHLRFEPGKPTPEFETIFDFSSTQGFLRAIEKCNGSGDCRKTSKSGGVMCPSYMASLDERNSTRARANTLREFLTNPPKSNPFDSKEIYESLDLCLSCKGCKTECPSNVDMTRYKAEFMQHYYDVNGIPLRTKMIGYINSFNQLGAIWPAFYNLFMSNKFLSGMIKKAIGFAPKRSMPLLYKYSLKAWINAHPLAPDNIKGKVHLFVDEFTNYNDVEVGMDAVKLLVALGYQVVVPYHDLSGRTFLSKGLVRTAKKIANNNVRKLSDVISFDAPLIGIEPSAILGFRDEFPDLVDSDLKAKSKTLANNCLLFEEFFVREVDKGNITKNQFVKTENRTKLHGHCHQKAVASTAPTKRMLSFPENYSVEEIPSGCCGMAGSFGYEKEHYDLSMKIGEMVLFPAVRSADSQEIISAPGTSCRHQIKDGTGKKALHPIQIMYNALEK